MSNSTHDGNHKKSKLDQFQLGFEYNRTLKQERSLTKQRTHAITP